MEGTGIGLVGGMVVVLGGLRLFTGRNPLSMGRASDAAMSPGTERTWTDAKKDKKDLI